METVKRLFQIDKINAFIRFGYWEIFFLYVRCQRCCYFPKKM